MAKQSGVNVLLQVGQGDGSPETFITLQGQQDGSLSLDLTTADISTSGGPRQSKTGPISLATGSG